MPTAANESEFCLQRAEKTDHTAQGEMGLARERVDMARLFQLVGRLGKGMKLAEDPRRRLAKSDASDVSIEQSHDIWFVVWRRLRNRPRFLPSQIAFYEAQQADQRGEVDLADRLRYAATEAQRRNVRTQQL